MIDIDVALSPALSRDILCEALHDVYVYMYARPS